MSSKMPLSPRAMKSRNSDSKRRTSAHRDDVELAGGAQPQRDDLALDRERRVLALLEQLDQPLAAVEGGPAGGVQVGGERGEGLELAELGEVQAQPAGDGLHRLDLRRATDAGHRDADVDGRADTGVEQTRLEEDLAVGDRDDVGRDVGRHVVALGLDERQAGHRARRRARRRASRSAPAGGSAGRRRRRGRPRGPADGAAAARPRGRPRPAWTGRRTRSGRACPRTSSAGRWPSRCRGRCT